MGQGIQVILIILIAFLAYMHCYMGSTMHNRPIIVATLVGLVLGDLQTGIIVGATLELVFMGAFPIGASTTVIIKLSNNRTSVAIGTASTTAAVTSLPLKII